MINPRKYRPDILLRHISILELLGQGKSRTQIMDKLGLQRHTVENTINNHKGKLEELKQALKHLNKEQGSDIENYETSESLVEESENEVLPRTNEETAELYTLLLERVYADGFLDSEEERENWARELGFESGDELYSVLEMLEAQGFLEKQLSKDSENEIYNISGAGEPYAKRERSIELSVSTEETADEGIEQEGEKATNESVMEIQTEEIGVNLDKRRENGFNGVPRFNDDDPDIAAAKLDLHRELSEEVRRQEREARR